MNEREAALAAIILTVSATNISPEGIHTVREALYELGVTEEELDEAVEFCRETLDTLRND